MNKLEMPLELALRKESTQRLLQELFDEQNWEGLMAAAEVLNAAWHQQSTISKWLAKEAADNLAEAYQATRKGLP
ncbi:MAG: hypothetical protein ACO27M_12420 [Vulcanococcus sp.]|jgi:hypothetical protein